MATRTLIFIPGIYGSGLKDAVTGKVEWASVPHLLSGRTKIACEVPGLFSKRVANLEPSHVLEHVPIVGKYLSMNAYGVALKKLRALCARHGVDLLPFAFDWREDPLTSVRRLARVINDLRSKGSIPYLYAHSYGGLLASYYLRYGGADYAEAEETWKGLDSIGGAILATVPFEGANVVFRNILQGAKLEERVTVITQTDYASFAAAYFLMPPSDRMGIFHPNLERADLNLLDVDTWLSCDWGLFSRAARRRHVNPMAVRDYLATILKRKGDFDRKQWLPIRTKPTGSVPLMVVAARGTKTVDRGVWLASQARADLIAFDSHDLAKYVPALDSEWSKIDGDGTLSLESQMPVPAIREIASEVLILKDKHQDMLHAGEVLTAVEDLISG